MQNNYKGSSPDKEEDKSIESPEEEDGVVKMALTNEEVKVKFTSNKIEGSRNGEAKVDIEQMQQPYAGMTKDELLKYANDPFWVRLRWTLFILFWLIWLLMLIGAIVIIVLAERCAPEPTADWWQKSVIYQVYPRSFKDSNDDGIGDLKGIESKLDYLQDELGIQTILINPFFESPMVDFGYDISNFTEVSLEYGTMEDFRSLVKQLKERDMKLILDFVPNHTSDKHPWFIKSRSGVPGYEDYYMWEDGKGLAGADKPNNWLSVFGGPAWTKDPQRNQYYYHDFLPQQPSLNLRNPAVQEELENILKFWLDQGADGFRVDAANHLFKDRLLRNEPASQKTKDDDSHYDSLSHIYTTAQPEVLELLVKWKQLINNYTNDGTHRILLTEVYDDITDVISFYGTNENPISDIPMNFQLLGINNYTTGSKVQELVQEWVYGLAEKPWAWSNWVIGNHDNKRVGSRVNPELVDGMNMVNLLLGGTPLTYYGEEIGMTDVEISYNHTLDPRGKLAGKEGYKEASRDPARTPMQWDNSTNAGFSTRKPWLPVNTNYPTVNVEAERSAKRSHLSVYKKLVALREQPAILFGRLDFPPHDFKLSKNVFAFFRVKKGTPGFIVVVNFGHTDELVNLSGASDKYGYSLSEDGTIEACSVNIPTESHVKCDVAKSKIPLSKIPLGPYQAVVLKFVPTFT